MSELLKHKIDPVGAVAFIFGCAVVVPSIAALGITLLAVVRVVFST